jgi:hypothetical protein
MKRLKATLPKRHGNIVAGNLAEEIIDQIQFRKGTLQEVTNLNAELIALSP